MEFNLEDVQRCLQLACSLDGDGRRLYTNTEIAGFFGKTVSWVDEILDRFCSDGCAPMCQGDSVRTAAKTPYIRGARPRFFCDQSDGLYWLSDRTNNVVLTFADLEAVEELYGQLKAFFEPSL